MISPTEEGPEESEREREREREEEEWEERSRVNSREQERERAAPFILKPTSEARWEILENCSA